MKVVEILIEHNKYSLNRPFSYVYFGDKKVERGYRVLVTFNHQELVGYVTKVEESNKKNALLFITYINDYFGK